MKKRRTKEFIEPGSFRTSAARPKGRPELLAPAGSLATWAAALEAGADAVYLGLKEFSARAFAANFSISDLTRLVPSTHERGAKVFVAFNSLLKEEELEKAARLLDGLERIGPDALILQDLGLFRLVKRHFPGFEVHASTLMAVHNLPGLNVLADLGFDRAVLARELTLNEVERLTARSSLGLEMFIHGALCFSFSGLCLMSSFLGGKGSLRGACTQPCRRRYTSGKKRGYFFSPTDLDATGLMGRIRELPLAALKIEGRMKGADYVSRVVRAYRLLLDAPSADLEEALAEARGLIESSPGRQGSTGFFLSAHPTSGLAPSRAAASGLFMGRVRTSDEEGARVRLERGLEVGDRLRVQFRRDDEREAFTLKKMLAAGRPIETADSGEEVTLSAPFDLTEGDLVFKVGAAGEEEKALASAPALAFRAAPGKKIKPSTAINKALDGIRSRPSARDRQVARPEVWYRLARAEEVNGLTPLRPEGIILPMTRPNVKRMAALRRRLGPLFYKVIWALPTLVFESEWTALRKDLDHLLGMKAARFMVSNLGHLPLLRRPESGRKGRRVFVYADHRLNCLNTQTEAALSDLGLSGVTICPESDDNNFSKILSRPGPVARLLYIFGRPPLFTSRFTPLGVKDNLPIESPRRERFRMRFDRGQTLVFAERPVFFAPLLRLRSLKGVKALIVDLEFDPRPAMTAKEVSEAIIRGRPMKNTSMFNLGRGLF